MRTALQRAQRRATLMREIARYRARLEEIGPFPITPQERRTFTMAHKSLRQHYRDLGEITFEEQIRG
jgi:predicted aminopeptidase